MNTLENIAASIFIGAVAAGACWVAYVVIPMLWAAVGPVWAIVFLAVALLAAIVTFINLDSRGPY